MKQTLVIFLVFFLLLSFINESDAWSRRRSGSRSRGWGRAVLHKRNYNGKILAIKTSQDDEGGRTTKHRFYDDKHTYEDANLL